MARLTTDVLKEYVETDLSDTELQSIIDQVDDEVSKIVGSETSKVEWFNEEGKGRYIFLQFPVSSIVGITEWTEAEYERTLSSDDYRIQGNQLVRLLGGTHSAYNWADIVKVEYVPDIDAERIKQVMIKLCKLYLEYKSVQSMSLGDYSEAPVDIEGERMKILRLLGGRWFA